jgi:hypothetical protein
VASASTESLTRAAPIENRAKARRYISIVVPSAERAGESRPMYDEQSGVLGRAALLRELIFVDHGSTDGSVALGHKGAGRRSAHRAGLADIGLRKYRRKKTAAGGVNNRWRAP